MRQAAARVLVVSALLVLGAACWSASRAVGAPFASLFVDPFSDYSALHLSVWDTPSLPFRAGARLIAVDGQPLAPGDARRLDAVLAARPAGALVDLTFEHGEAAVTARLPVRRVGAHEVWWLFAFYALLGCSFLWSGFAVWRVAPGRVASWVYLAMSVNAFTFLVTFFDYHTTRLLSPLFAASSLGNAWCLLGLALTFPNPPRWVEARRRLMFGLLALAGSSMVVLALCAALIIDLRWLRLVVNAAVPLSLLVLAASSLGRYVSQSREARVDLHWALLSLGLVPVWLAVTALVDQQLDVDLLHLSLPLAGLLVPAGIGLSLIKRDFLSTGAIVTRNMLTPPILFTGAALGGAAWAWSRTEAASVAAATCLALVVFVLAVVALWAGLTRLFFRGRALYQPLITRLADRLALVHDAKSVRAALEEVTSSLLPECTVRVVDDAQPTGVTWSEGTPRVLLVPLTTGSRTLGALSISARPSGALFSADELAILETLSSFGAVALHNANTVQQLNELRALEVSVSREDKRLSVDILAAEVAHELAYPLSYFRHFLRGLARGNTPAAEDVDIGQEEVARLERMLTSVRRLQTPEPLLRQVALRPTVERAIALLGPGLAARAQRVEVSLALTTVKADADQLLQVLTNLLRNASEATGPGGRLGITAQARAGHLELFVWDDGPGVPEAARAHIFSPWFTTRPDGTGLGLAVTQRIVRSFGWTIEIERREALTCFVLHIPTLPEAP